MNKNTQTALQSWNGVPPVWVDELAKQCDLSNQTKVARKLKVSSALVSQVLANKYLGNLDNVQAAVEGAYMDGCVSCPVLGDLATNECLWHQRQPYSNTNSVKVRLFRSCKVCSHNRTKGEAF